MSTVTETIAWAPRPLSTTTTTAAERLPHRFDGILIAVGASVALWSGIGVGLWALVDLLG